MKGGKVFNAPTRTDDLVEIQQLLAKYAVTITQGDVEGLVTVFTPDGTYSAFGDTYTLDRFPVLVDAAPKGLFMTGHGAGRPCRGRRHRHRHAAAVLHRALQARHAHRLLPRHLCPHRRRVAAENPCHDVHPAQRRPRPRPSARDRAGPKPDEPRRSTRRRVPVAVAIAWLDEHDLTPPAGRSLAGRAARPALPGAQRALRRGLDALGLARIGGRARRTDDPARDRRRGDRRPRARRAGPVLDARSTDPDDDRLRPTGARRGDGAAAAVRPRNLVPGLLRARLGQRPGIADHAGRAARRRRGSSTARRCGPASRSTRRGAFC